MLVINVSLGSLYLGDIFSTWKGAHTGDTPGFDGLFMEAGAAEVTISSQVQQCFTANKVSHCNCRNGNIRAEMTVLRVDDEGAIQSKVDGLMPALFFIRR